MNAHLHPLFQQLLAPYAPPAHLVDLGRRADGKPPRVTIWKNGCAIDAGGLYKALGRELKVTRVFLKRFKETKAIVTMHWVDGSWASFCIDNYDVALDTAEGYITLGKWPPLETI